MMAQRRGNCTKEPVKVLAPTLGLYHAQRRLRVKVCREPLDLIGVA
jgi:hypothetical protein